MKRKPGRPRKRGCPRKEPGEPVDHRLTPKMRVTILAIVVDGKSMADAAAAAGLTKDAKAMKGNPAAREFYMSELKALLHCAKAKAAHALIKELDGPNVAARTLLEENERTPTGNNMPQVPGFVSLLPTRAAHSNPSTSRS